MIYKILIGSLAICTLAGCVADSGPVSEDDDKPATHGLFSPYQCKDRANSGYTFNILVKMRPKTSQTTSDLKVIGSLHKGLELYQVNLNYFIFEPAPSNSNLHTTHSDINYNNVDFEYNTQDLILKIPKSDTLPACQIRFKKGGKTGQQTCEFENNDASHRATTYKFSCVSAGKTGLIPEEEL